MIENSYDSVNSYDVVMWITLLRGSRSSYPHNHITITVPLLEYLYAANLKGNRKGKKKDTEAVEANKLYEEIGRLKVENGFLKKKL